MPHVFISYQHDDADFVEVLKNRLEREGFEVWTDSDQLRPGEDWREGIDQAIKASSALIVVMTPAAKASEYVTYEWSFAWGVHVAVLPLLLKATPVHPRLETLQYLDFTNRQARPWDRLIERVRQLIVQTEAQAALPTAAATTPTTQPPATASPSPSLQRSQQGEMLLPQYLKKIIIELEYGSGYVHTQAIEKLTQINSPQARELFLKVMQQDLDSANEDERLEALHWLAQVDFAEARELLVAALDHPLHGMPLQAAIHLANLKDGRAIPILLRYIEHGDQSTTESVMEAINSLGAEAVPALFEATQQERSTNLRGLAARALGKIGDSRAVPALIPLLDDKRELTKTLNMYPWLASVARYAADALQQIGTPEALAAVEEWKESQPSVIRRPRRKRPGTQPS